MNHPLVQHLQEVFDRLCSAGLIICICGKKCHLGMSKITYLGCDFSADEMSPSQQKIQFGQHQPTPLKSGHCFILPALHPALCRHSFTSHSLNPEKHFRWKSDCAKDFEMLKKCLTKAPILTTYPQFSSSMPEFSVWTWGST